MINHYINALTNSWNDEGRATRSEFWFFMLFHVAIGVALFAFDFFTEWKLLTIYIAATLVQVIVLFVRRLHDTGKNGWWLILFPVALFFTLLKSQPGENKYERQ